jgi:signal transduction histidine kinase
MKSAIPFRPSAPGAVGDAHLANAYFEDPTPHSHAVQFYESEDFLAETVGKFLGAGLDRRDRMIVIATPEHREAFLLRLNAAQTEAAVAADRFLLLDAQETLSAFMADGMPDGELFHETLSAIIARTGDARRPLRAYGEMVDLLWREGNSRAAIRLEELWNDAGRRHSFSLLCAYTMGNFYKEGDSSRFMEICGAHSHVIPTESFTELHGVRARLREITLLQQRAQSLEHEIAHREELEAALRDALRDRERMEEELRETLRREKEAREQAEANDSFKEMFLGILGHDLRNPLNTMLTTARLMERKGGAPAPERVARIITSGIRMERMIAQVLDLTRARLADGIPVDRSQEHDLTALASKIAAEVRVAHPQRIIDLTTEAPCFAFADADRFEQVVSNLLANAISHGDATRPITVSVERREHQAALLVHNFGPPIDSATLPRLFSPFKRAMAKHDHSSGLGLGLYIVERIVAAHGGAITVESTLEAGTTFEVVLPLAAHG